MNDLLIRRFGLLGLLTAACSLSGCFWKGGLSAVEVPNVDPSAAADAAIEMYDQNADGALRQDELVACPGLRTATRAFDADGDAMISRDELSQRLEKIYGSGVGLVTVGCTITLDGRPLVGAQVRFVPEPFLAEAVHVAEGVSEADGMAVMAIANDKLPEDQHGLDMMQVGLYRVEVTHPNRDLPAKFNKKTLLGHEVSTLSPGGANPRFALSSR